MIFLFTDFGRDGPYVGQVAAVLARRAPSHRVIDLFNDVPPFDPRGAAHLLAAYASVADVNDVVVAVVDPGVGTDRRALAVLADGRWLVGPDNGLLAVVCRQAKAAEVWEIRWRPPGLSTTFHGRDLFAPAATILVEQGREGLVQLDAAFCQDMVGLDWPADYPAIVYFDRYGNAMTGLRAANLAVGQSLRVAGHHVPYGRTFGQHAAGALFWYENANGLAEIAINQGSAQEALSLTLGLGIDMEIANTTNG
jgi:S-adenosylmethionine hydrolase